jgi:hypothetical protein
MKATTIAAKRYRYAAMYQTREGHRVMDPLSAKHLEQRWLYESKYG